MAREVGRPDGVLAVDPALTQRFLTGTIAGSVVPYDTLPPHGGQPHIALCKGKLYFWNGTQWKEIATV